MCQLDRLLMTLNPSALPTFDYSLK